jgi:hypothetical protein
LIVVSDTSPILNLARIGRLELLPALYHHVIIPSAVYDELVASKRDLPSARPPIIFGFRVVTVSPEAIAIRRARRSSTSSRSARRLDGKRYFGAPSCGPYPNCSVSGTPSQQVFWLKFSTS